MCVKLIKIFDERLAIALCDGGFSYMTEKINKDETVYVFQETPDLLDVLGKLSESGEFQEIKYVSDTSLGF